MPSPGIETGRPAPKGWRSWLLRPIRWLLTGLGFLGRLVLVTWATLAIYYSNWPWAWSRLALAVACAAFSVWALWLTRRPRMGWVFLALFAAVVVWYIAIPPSHDRPWRAEVAVLPRTVIDGERVRITGVRDFDYRSVDDFTVRYIDGEVSLAHLRRQLTPGLISSLPGTAGLPPFISFSTSYPELPPMPNCMARRLQGAGARRGQEAVVAVLVSRHTEPSAAADRGGR